MTLGNFLFTAILIVSVASFGVSARRLLLYLQIGKPDDRFTGISERLKRVFSVALMQTKLLREPLAGTVHLAIFWGFLALIVAVVESIGEGIAGPFSFRFLGGFYSFITFSQEIFCLLVAFSVVVALWRRFVSKVKRLQVSAHESFDAALILVWILFIVSALLLQNAARISDGIYAAGMNYPVSSRLAEICFAGGAGTGSTQFFWWSHILLVLGFLNYLPYSKHLHVLTSIPNVYFSSLKPRGALTPIDLADESAVRFGVKDVDDLTWKQLLDGYTCTECGRCDSVCPANITGKRLSPRKIIVDTRRRTMEKAPLLVGDKNEAAEDALNHTLVDQFISAQELWACTTCLACVYECPVMIEHVNEIVDMRRGLVLNESRFPAELRATFDNLERNFTPWGFSHSTRADWAQGLEMPVMANGGEHEILFWVGCAGAYDARYRNVTVAFAKLMKHAGVKFGILGVEEKCNGDAARRMGNEYLAQTLVSENVATLNRYGVKKIVTTCPHCYHSLKNEYPQFGGTYDVVHHSDFLDQLVREGKIRPERPRNETVTFHDSCYLARYNGVVQSPRAVINSIPQTAVTEMGRSKDRGLCCGAGGGRMWMEEKEGKRINIERTEEVLATNASTVGTACPFCMTMLNDGVKAKEAADRVAVKDIAELLLEAVETNDERIGVIEN
ncbi:MAG TPA: (Fe-S)-binding protein [Bacteroidota bacterium]|nr:(Fe-S)-binding protein [Bacteroidota bacterium]